MRKTIFILITWIVLAALPAAAQETTNDEAKITLERTACFGTCPIYTVTLYEDGRVVYEGEKYVDVAGEQAINIGEEAFAELMQAVEDVGYFEWDDEYMVEDATDHPYAMTSVTRDGETKTINHYTGDGSAPPELSYLENWIDVVAMTQQWTGQAPALPSFTSAGPAVISLERTPCFGTCPAYQVAIHEDGTVVFVGMRFVDEIGIRIGEIDAVASLLEEITEAGFFEWDDEYLEMRVTDLPYVYVSALGDEGHKRISHYLGDGNAPEALTEIEDKIDSAVDVSQWIGDGGQGLN
jgi:Domain of unknown function (DUF6438)